MSAERSSPATENLLESEPLPPWLQESWQALFARFQNASLPHALLVEGAPGIGKNRFTRFAVQTFLCRQASVQGPCGDCASCSLLAAGSHPDTLSVSPAKESKVINGNKVIKDSNVIKIDQIRQLIERLQLTSQYGGHKLAILQPADAMTRNAANGLLKTLEEPARDNALFLLTDNPGALPATVRSRCQRISLGIADRAVALQWLETQGVADAETALSLSQDGPLLALKVMDAEHEEVRQRIFKAWQGVVTGKASIARSVESISELPTRDCLQWFCTWTTDSVILQTDSEARIRNPDLRPALLALAGCLPTVHWFTLYDQLLHLHQTDSASFKTQAVLEGIFADIRLKSI